MCIRVNIINFLFQIWNLNNEFTRFVLSKKLIFAANFMEKRKSKKMNMEKARNVLGKYFGYDSFWPLQEKVIQSVINGEDGLVLMPTGGGKSICFQVPAIALSGTCVVISPLISLMKDQVEALLANGVRAAFWNSTQDAAQQREVGNRFFEGDLDILYVSPEKMLASEMVSMMQKIKINLIAIDEAHCISSWGHDFRPHYTRLTFLKKTFPNVPILALTATADRVTRADILQLLNINEGNQFIASFDRPNIKLEVRPAQKRLQQILDFIDEHPNESGIIYCLSRKSTENVAAKLKNIGINAAYYHAGMTAEARSRVQEDFIKDKVPVICATIAFGMGIDKSNVRWVIHYNMSKNIEGYYQEIGRSGRDGSAATALLFYSYGDLLILRDIISKNESENLDIQLAKLERMKEYAEATACRRRVLLNYFNEDTVEDCGNCDVCDHPPEYFDGTLVAQKALSAVTRLKQKVATGMLIDVLRGSNRKALLDRGFQHIKTYGSGSDIPRNMWEFYIRQLVNLGYLSIAYDDYNSLKLTNASTQVLFHGKKVKLVRLSSVTRKSTKKAKPGQPEKRERVRDALFEEMRILRRDLAQKIGVPPYIIFSDRTLEEMAAARPTTPVSMRRISGVGDQKLEKFGDQFIKIIENYIEEEQKKGID